MKRKLLSIDLGDQHDAWFALAKKYKQRPATLGRQTMLNVLLAEQAGSPEIRTEIRKNSHPDASNRVHQSLTLRADEAEAIDEFARHLGVNRRQALIFIIREYLAQEHHFSQEECMALEHSNVKLSRIASNLNQMAKKINSLAQDEVRYGDLKYLTSQVKEKCREVKRQVEQHCTTVCTLLNASRNRERMSS